MICPYVAVLTDKFSRAPAETFARTTFIPASSPNLFDIETPRRIVTMNACRSDANSDTRFVQSLLCGPSNSVISDSSGWPVAGAMLIRLPADREHRSAMTFLHWEGMSILVE